jgi:hypothetical protein
MQNLEILFHVTRDNKTARLWNSNNLTMICYSHVRFDENASDEFVTHLVHLTNLEQFLVQDILGHRPSNCTRT